MLIAEEFNCIEIGKRILVPMVDGRKQKKRTGYAEVIDMRTKQSGEQIILVRQGRIRMPFTLRELQKFWDRCPKSQPRIIEVK